MTVSVEPIRPRLGDHIENNAACLPILGIIVVCQHLELFHFFDRGAQCIPGRDYLVRDISSVKIDLNATVINSSRSDKVAGYGGEIVLDTWSGSSQRRI